MNIWIDAQLPPTLACWITNNFEVEAVALRDLGLRDARDIEIFEAARVANAVIMTKDSDFIDLMSIRHTASDFVVDVWQRYESELAATTHAYST
jgi:predicted nuclease of predicted toxin-antitoxin system